MDAKQIRQTFLDFFAEKQHTIVPSAPMVLKNDPTLLFTNAGMNPFKDLFLGNAEITQPRIADTQKCLRVSGKHNDLEEVGHDTYHHTMFEMLGNWSFGDYFKQEAITWAWELLTQRYNIPKDQLYVTYFGGDSEENLDTDTEARNLWATFCEMDRILPGNKKDNFWEMGDVGPCGPCSEIHVDIRPDSERQKQDGRELVNQNHPHVIEIWNLVFMQFNRKADGRLEKLSAQHVDTGMGLERLCMVLQGKTSNYDTDLFQPYIAKLEKLSGIKYNANHEASVAMRVISDHIRAVGIAIADGQLPSNTGAGYVIRRILRRALRYGFSFLNLKEPFFHKLTDDLVQSLGDVFPELKAQHNFMTQVIREEETAFLRTLETGLDRLQKIMAEPGAAGSKSIDGEKAFELYDTYGFPFDLTSLIAQENGFNVDEAGFQKALNIQKDRSRSATKLSTGDWTVIAQGGGMEFIGYDTNTAPVNILKYREVEAKGKTLFQVVLNKTPFYPEGGGQVGDTGKLFNSNETIHVLNTIKENDLIIHLTDKLPTDPEKEFTAEVNGDRRLNTARNHSATHLLHAALREILGKHVEQRGSLVSPDYLRFDFSHPGKVEPEQLEAIQNRVNEQILKNIALEEYRNLPFDEAISRGAMALFGEKYGNEVRMICFDAEYSAELCGGTHVKATGEIGSFFITSEASVAAGIRRIEAFSGKAALQWSKANRETLNEIRQLVKNPKDPIKGLQNLIDENDALKSKIEKLEQEALQQFRHNLLNTADQIGNVKWLSAEVELSAAQARNLAFSMKSEKGIAMLLGLKDSEKPGLALFFSDDLVAAGFNAKTWMAELAPMISGGGGGQDFFAAAGGKNPAGLSKALQAGKEKFTALIA
jgi:alanyl-tRNA synthetase